MSYEAALADLKEQFGPKKFLNSAEVAACIGRTPDAFAMMRLRGQFPKPSKIAGRIAVSIYDLARFIDDPEKSLKEAEPAPKVSKPRAQKATAGDSSKPTRRPPPLGDSIRALRESVEEMTMQLEFWSATLAELERIELDRSI